MTDNEIIKALECCTSGETSDVCKDCPFDSICDKDSNALARHSLNIIKRLQSERDYWMSQYTLKSVPPSATAIAAQQCFERMRMEHLQRMEQEIERLAIECGEARRDCAVAEKNHKTAIQDFKTALLKKIFPYDAVDKKQYSINAYAVEKAIAEVAEQMLGG